MLLVMLYQWTVIILYLQLLVKNKVFGMWFFQLKLSNKIRNLAQSHSNPYLIPQVQLLAQGKWDICIANYVKPVTSLNAMLFSTQLGYLI